MRTTAVATMRPSRAAVPKLWPDGTILCLASGPSLTQADVDYTRGKVDGTIAINDTWKLAPWADVLYSSDQRWYVHYRGVPEFQGLKFGIDPFRIRPEWNITSLRNTGEMGIETDPTGLRTGRNSGAAALNLALHLGAKRILLLGYDLGGRGHWFGSHPRGLSNPTEANLAMFRQHIGSMAGPLRDAGVSVINCTRTTQLDAFPRVRLEDVL